MVGELQVSLLGPVAFSIFINSMAKVMESSFVRFAHDTKLGGTVITQPSRGTWSGRRNEQTGKWGRAVEKVLGIWLTMSWYELAAHPGNNQAQWHPSCSGAQLVG